MLYATFLCAHLSCILYVYHNYNVSLYHSITVLDISYYKSSIMKQLLVLVLLSLVCLANSKVLQVILVDSSSNYSYAVTAATTAQEINNCPSLLNGYTLQVKTVSSQFLSSVVEVAEVLRDAREELLRRLNLPPCPELLVSMDELRTIHHTQCLINIQPKIHRM